jgi:ankyrin repeat protein
MHSSIEVLQLLNQSGYSRNVAVLELLTKSGRTPLEVAAAFGQDEMLEYLVSSDCSIDPVPKPLPHHKVSHERFALRH